MPVTFQYNLDQSFVWWIILAVGFSILGAIVLHVAFHRQQWTGGFLAVSLTLGILVPLCSSWLTLPDITSLVADSIQNTYKVDGIAGMSNVHTNDLRLTYTMTITSGVDHKPYLCQYQQTTPDRKLLHSHFPTQHYSRYQVDGRVLCNTGATVLQHRYR